MYCGQVVDQDELVGPAAVQPPSYSEGKGRSEDEGGKKERDSDDGPSKVKDAVDTYVKLVVALFWTAYIHSNFLYILRKGQKKRIFKPQESILTCVSNISF